MRVCVHACVCEDFESNTVPSCLLARKRARNTLNNSDRNSDLCVVHCDFYQLMW